MASTPETLTTTQLKAARTQLWHQGGSALHTQDDARAWLEEAGLVPYYPHAQFAVPQSSFAEAVLGRPENGWIPSTSSAAKDSSGEEAYASEMEDEEPEDEVNDPDAFVDEESGEDEDGADEDLERDEDNEADEQDGDPEASDEEVMLSDDDEFAEDEGDEIAEEDRIHAAVDPVPNDVRGNEAPAPEPVNGFSAEERATVRHMLSRMVAEGSAVPLNLLGAAGSEPDFICSAQAFSFVYTLRGDKGWKQEPAQTGSMRVSPLAVKVSAILKDKGAMSAQDLATELGQGIVESAVVRALSELWAILRVTPQGTVDDQPELWELLTARHIRHVKAGANAGQPTALSALLSLYLSQVIAASGDEMEIYLSPLAARSRIHEVVSALAASRQLEQIVVEGKTLFYVPGTLENLPAGEPEQETIPAAVPRSRYEEDDRRALIAERRAREAAGEAPRERRPFNRSQDRGEGAGRDNRQAGPRRPSFGDRRPGGFSPQRRSGSFGGTRPEGGFATRPDSRERRPFQRRDEAAVRERPSNAFARPWDEKPVERSPQQENSAPREEHAERRSPFTPRDGERRPFVPRDGGNRRPYSDRPAQGEGRPFAPRQDGTDRPYASRGGDRPFAPRGDRPFTSRSDRPSPRSEGDRPFRSNNSGDRRPFAGGGRHDDRPQHGGRPFTPREGGERRPFTSREDGERRPYTPREGGDRRPFAPRGDRPFTPRGDRPFVPREQQERRSDRPTRPREDGERRTVAPRGDRPFTPRGDRPFIPGGDRPFTPRSDRPFAPREDRSSAPREGRSFPPHEGGERRPFTNQKPYGGVRPGFGENRPNRDRFSGEPGEGRPAFKSGGKSAGPGGAKFGGSGFGRDRKGAPGGYGKPGFSPARRGPGSGSSRGGAPKRRPE